MKILGSLDMLTEHATDYREIAQQSISRNKYMNEIKDGEAVEQRIIDAVLVDFINYMGLQQGVDYALYTKDLKE